jgi:membrane protease YdiL (CAAX protease family)
MRLTCPGALYIFKEGSFLRKLKSLGTGLLLGFVCIIILNLAQWISGTTAFSYNGFDWHLIPLIPLVFIQCSAEEMLLRGYVPAVLGEKHSWDVVCFVSGILFIFQSYIRTAGFIIYDRTGHSADPAADIQTS